MCSFSNEMFLRDYFTFDAVVGRFCDERSLFDCLAKVYYIDPKTAKQLFELVDLNKVRNIASLKDYKRYRRLRQYSEACKLKSDTTESENDVLTIKGKALYATSNCGLIDAGNNTKASVYANIVDKANAGQVTALRIYGVLQCEGIFFDKNRNNGIKNLTRAARWNSIESILALLRYDTENDAAYTDMLYTLAAGTPYEDISVRTQNNRRTRVSQKVKECTLLSKVFGRGQVTPSVYLPVYANLLYSEIIPFRDKEKLLLSENRETIASYMDLPLKLTMRKFACDASAITDLSLTRTEEQNALIQNALNSDIRHFETFKPLCLCSDSRYMRNYYMEAILKLYKAAHVATISVADLGANDFESSMGNIFIRSCNEDKGNVFLISFVGDISEGALKEACDFLQSAKRGKMRLSRPNIEINLGAVLPICFCDKRNAQTVSKYCDKIEIASPNKEELLILVGELIAAKEKRYGINGLTVENGLTDKLLSVSIDAADAALELAITANRRADTALTLTEENSGKYIKRRETSRGFGYGGCKDDN
ncbi:MAG: hypothetical protein NC099_03305 [Corallococcus sp.]|nr:hypothetical protein [Corallococcus sp.]